MSSSNEIVYCLNICPSVQTHVSGLGSVPRGHLRRATQLDQLTRARFVHNALLLALVQQLLLTGGQREVFGRAVLFVVFVKAQVFGRGVDALVGAAGEKAWPEGGPGGHEELLLGRVYIDDAVLVLHEVLKAGGGVEHRGNGDRRGHKAKE